MDLGSLLESPQGSESSSRDWACTCAFLPTCSAVSRFPSRGSRDLWLCLEAFPRGFPTGLSHVPPWWESILGVKVEAVQGKQVPLEWTETSGGLGNGVTTLEFLSPFLWRAPPLEMRRERREFFPLKQGKDPSSRARRRKRGSPGCVRDPRASSEWRRVCRELLELQKGCEGPFGSSRG